jgi:hypothetical protein
MASAYRLLHVVGVAAVGVLLGGAIVAGAFTTSDRLRPEKCNVLADRSGREALTLAQGDRLESCEMLTGMSRSAVRAVLGTAGLEPPMEDGGRLEYYQLRGNRSGSVYFSSCVLELEYARDRVVNADTICKDD